LQLFFTRKEAFEWLKTGKKTIDIRKGTPHRGEVAVFQAGRKVLRMNIVKKEMGRLREVVRSDNYRLIVPSAVALDDAVAYLHELYGGGDDDVFTAYYIKL
jgi:ASC-1-like (ASCH) protein